MLPSCSVNRILSFNANRSIFTSGISVGSDLKHSVTGKGPFVDLPTIKPLGNPGGFVKVLLPQGSVLNVQSTSVSFIKGDNTKLSARLALQCGDMWYQEIKSGAPCTLLLSNNELSSPNQTYVSVCRTQKWIILNTKDLLAWSGLDLSIIKRSSRLFVEGTGFFIARGYGKIQNFYLKEGESIFIQSHALVATCCSIESDFNLDETLKQDSLSLRKLSSILSHRLSSIYNLNERMNFGEWYKIIMRHFSGLSSLLNFSWFSRSMMWLKRQDNFAYKKVRGPGQVLVQTKSC